MASDLGLEEGRDYVHVCLGTDFPKLIESLSNATTPPPGVPRCDVGASSITETSMRRQAGIEFSQATQRDKLAVLVDGKVQTGGPWAFFQPLHLSVWLSMLATILVVPFFVFFCEYVLSNRCGPCPLGPHRCVFERLCAPRANTLLPRSQSSPETVAVQGLASRYIEFAHAIAGGRTRAVMRHRALIAVDSMPRALDHMTPHAGG